MKSGDKVKLKSNYLGYFRHFKDQVLTIDKVFESEKSVTIKEFLNEEAYHLQRMDNFNLIEENKNEIK